LNSVDLTEFDRKVQDLIRFGEKGSKAQYVSTEVTRKDPWTHSNHGLQRKDQKFMKMWFVRGGLDKDEKPYVFPLMIAEGNQYDRSTCFKVTGYIVLPLRYENGKIEGAITVRNGAGSFAETTFTCPRKSLSNLVGTQAHQGSRIIYHYEGRIDVMRGTGTTDFSIAWVTPDTKINEDVVWFTLDELDKLLEHELMTDAPSRMLIERLLRSRETLKPPEVD